MTTMNGNVLDMAAWFQIPLDACGPDDDEERCAVLGQVYRFTAYATHREGDGTRLVLLKTPGGRCLVETAETSDGIKLVTFDYVADGGATRVRFWMNASSVADLGQKLRSAPDAARRSFDSLFFGEAV